MTEAGVGKRHWAISKLISSWQNLMKQQPWGVWGLNRRKGQVSLKEGVVFLGLE